MTQIEFNQLPSLLTRAQVIACGISERVLDGGGITVKLSADVQEVPFGKIGAVPIGKGRKHQYRKCDVAKVNGWRS